MRRFLASLFSAARPSAKSAASATRTRLGLHPLEAREVPATFITNDSGTQLTILSTLPQESIELRSPSANELTVLSNGNEVGNFQNLNLNNLRVDAAATFGNLLVRGVPETTDPFVVVTGFQNVTIGNSNAKSALPTLTQVRSPLGVFVNPEGTLSILGSGETAAKTVEVTSTSVTGLAPERISYIFQGGVGAKAAVTLATGSGDDAVTVSNTFTNGNASLTISTGGGADTINLRANTTPVTLNGGSGNDTFNIGSATGHLANVRDLVTIDGGSGTNTLVVNDGNRLLTGTLYDAYLDATPQGGRIDVAHFFLASGDTLGSSVVYNGIQTARFVAPTATGASAVSVLGTQPGVLTEIQAGGVSTVTLGDSGSMNRIAGDVTVSRSSFGGTLVLDDSTTPTTLLLPGVGYTLGQGSVERRMLIGSPSVPPPPTRTIRFDDNMGDVRIRGSSGDDSFTVAGVRGGNATYTVQAGAGDDRLRGADTANQWVLSGMGSGQLNSQLTYSGIQSLIGRTQEDTFRVIGAGGVSGSIQAGGGFDTISYAEASTGVTVNLAEQRGTRVANGLNGRLTGIESVIGSNFSDILTGDALANVLHGMDGTDTIVGGGGRDLLFGGMGADFLSNGNFETLFVAADYRVAPTTLNRLHDLWSEWTRTDATFQERMFHIRFGGGLNENTVLSYPMIVEDAEQDTLDGGTANDLYFVNPINTDFSTNDLILNITPGDAVVNDI